MKCSVCKGQNKIKPKDGYIKFTKSEYVYCKKIDGKLVKKVKKSEKKGFICKWCYRLLGAI